MSFDMEEIIKGTLANLDATLTSIKVSCSTQGLRDIVSTYEGEPHKCREWLTNVDKFAELNGEETTNGKIRLAYMTARGVVSDFIKRYTRETPVADITWAHFTKSVISHFSVITDSEQAHDALRKIKQRPGESASLLGERIYELAKDAYADYNLKEKNEAKKMADRQLVDYFIDGLADRAIKLKVFRKGVKTLDEAVTVAREEASFMQRFEDRTRGETPMEVDTDMYNEEDESTGVDVSQLRPRRACHKCGRTGHYARDCRDSSKPSHYTTRCQKCKRVGHRMEDCHHESVVLCQKCHKFGHRTTNCPYTSDTYETNMENQSPHGNNNRRCWHCNKVGHLKRDCYAHKAFLQTRNGNRRPWRGRRSSNRNNEQSENRKTETFQTKITNNMNSCKVQIQRCVIRALVDTGSELTLLNKRIYDSLTFKPQLKRKNISLHSANGSSMTVLGVVDLEFKIHGLKLSQETLIVSDLSRNMILGRDFLSKHKVRIYCDLNRLRINDVYVPLDLDAHIAAMARACENITLKPQTVYVSMAKIKRSPYFEKGEYGFEPGKRGFLADQPELKVMPSVVTLKNNRVPVQVVNTSNKTLRIRKGCVLGTLDDTPRTEVNGVFTNEVTQVTDEEFCKQIKVSDGDRSKVQPFLLKNRDIFAFSDLDLKQTDLCTGDIDTGSHDPINLRPYRLAYKDREVVSKTVDDLLEAGLIERSASCWSFPIVMVDKKPEAPGMPCKRRMCIDFRKLNDIVHIRSFPLPLIDDIVSRLNGTTYFTTVDLRSGFHQIPLTESAKEKCSFSCFKGKFSFRVLPFGLKDAPSIFQRMVTRLLEGCEDFAVAYIDDILIHTSGSLEDHLQKVQKVMNKIRKHSLRLKLTKCQWAMKEITYLGYKVTRKGIAPDENKVEAIRNLKTPESVREVRSVLGAVGYFRKMIPRFADIAAPLVALTKKYARFRWNPECQAAFEELKRQLTVVPLLAHANPRASYRLYTDASNIAVGAVLCQQAEGETWVPGIPNEKPIYFLSHKLPDSKARALDVAQKELYAMVYALDKLHHFLYGAEFEIWTDHQPLKYLFSAEQKNRKIQAWALNVNSYNCKIKYLKGTENVMADLLSRSPPTNESTGEDYIPEIRDDALECSVLNSKAEVKVEGDTKRKLPKLDGFDLKAGQAKDPELMDLNRKLDYHEMALESLHKKFMEVLRISKTMKNKRNTYANQKGKSDIIKVGDLENHRKATSVEYRVHADSLHQANTQCRVPPRKLRQLRTARSTATLPSDKEESSSSDTDSGASDIYDFQEHIDRAIIRMTRLRGDSESEGDIPQSEPLRGSRVLTEVEPQDDREEEDWVSADEEMDVDTMSAFHQLVPEH